MMKDMKSWYPKHIQLFMLSAGNYGCYALQIIHITQKCGVKINEMYALIRGIQEGYIGFNPDDYNDKNNWFVHEPVKFLEMLTGEGGVDNAPRGGKVQS